MRMHIDYNNRVFRSTANSAGGDVDTSTTFHYRHVDDIVWGTYGGGPVAFGTLIAAVMPDGRLNMRYHHITTGGHIKVGQCVSTPTVLADGRLRLDEAWTWTEGGEGSGGSCVEEVVAPSSASD